FEEISRLTDLFIGLGVDKVRLTGGEPLLRRGLPSLIAQLAAKPGLRDLAITTNGVLLAEQAPALKAAGLHRLTVSLDTLDPTRFTALTRRTAHAEVLEGIRAATHAGFSGTKLDTVVMRGVNDDEIVPLIEFARTVPAEIRFIEYMDVGGATRWSMDKVVSRREILDVVRRRYGGGGGVGGGGGGRRGGAAARRSLPPARRDDLRHHRVDHRAVLRRLRPEPPHGRRPLVPLPLRHPRHRPAGAAPAWRVQRGARADDR